ncbi:MAG: DDE-type integrase/transposase/recombinase [Thermovenabulum sp.]|uniref:DDE-type integrase/transposase/recombinase n=1 Tax=Thermovenabulum sp. TaxID=3100335 RepID=UPI003C7CBE88
MDITYVTLFPRIIFVLGIIDTYTLKMVGYKAGFSITFREVAKKFINQMIARGIQVNLTIRTDNGLQFKSKEFEKFCRHKGIFHERIKPHQLLEYMPPSKFYEEILRNNLN